MDYTPFNHSPTLAALPTKKPQIARNVPVLYQFRTFTSSPESAMIGVFYRLKKVVTTSIRRYSSRSRTSNKNSTACTKPDQMQPATKKAPLARGFFVGLSYWVERIISGEDFNRSTHLYYLPPKNSK